MKRATLGITVLFALLGLLSGGRADSAEPLTITVVSNRADLVSGGDALVELSQEASKVTLNGADVTGEFAKRANGKVLGFVTGLKVGENILKADGYQITITNHPIGGPVFSGPQIQPWTCADGAKDDQCNRPAQTQLYYKSTGQSGLQQYDPESPPSDVATTTTDTGEEVPFIVRHEVGVLDRDEYRIASLADPDDPKAQPTPWTRAKGINSKLVITHGASCDTSYEQAEAPDVLNETALGKGFIVMSHALDNAGHNCNIITQAESLVMTKERVIEQYGAIRYTIGTGCSGGSLVQQQVANAYPGLYQGITPQCSFTDAWSSAQQYVDYVFLRAYFEDPTKWAPGVVWTPIQLMSAYGHPNPANPITFTTVIPNSGQPTRECPGVPDEDVFHPKTNPDGVRCTLQDYMVNVFGRRPDGWAERPFDNVGIQYGLSGLLNGTMTPAQFIDLNANIGGAKMNGQAQPERSEATTISLQRVYQSGAVDSANNLDQVAIIDLRGPDPGAFHDVYRTYSMRARLEREHGTAANQVLWRGQVPLLGDVTFTDDAILAVDSWLAEVEKDTRDIPLAQKIIEDKPDSVTDRCTNSLGDDIPPAVCDTTVQSYASPRIEAGVGIADDTLKCQLKPVSRADYPALVTDADLNRIREIFPTGVCDYTKPGVEQQGAIAWRTYDVPGGREMGPAPVSIASTDAAEDAARVRPTNLPATGGTTPYLAPIALTIAAAIVVRRVTVRH